MFRRISSLHSTGLSLALVGFTLFLSACSSNRVGPNFAPWHVRFQEEVSSTRAENLILNPLLDGFGVIVQRLPAMHYELQEYAQVSEDPAGELIFGSQLHYTILEGTGAAGSSVKYAMMVVRPGDYHVAGSTIRYHQKAMTKPSGLLPKVPPASLGYIHFTNDMWREPDPYLQTVDHYKPVITGFVGNMPIATDMYMGSRTYTEMAFKKPVPTKVISIKPKLMDGNKIMTLRTSVKAGEIVVLPTMQVDEQYGVDWERDQCAEGEDDDHWLCPIKQVTYHFITPNPDDFKSVLRSNDLDTRWAHRVRPAKLDHDYMLTRIGDGPMGGVYVLGAIRRRYDLPGFQALKVSTPATTPATASATGSASSPTGKVPTQASGKSINKSKSKASKAATSHQK